MTNLIAKIKTALTNAALFITALFTLGLGFAFLGTIALFGLLAVGAILMASLFAPRTAPASAHADTAA